MTAVVLMLLATGQGGERSLLRELVSLDRQLAESEASTRAAEARREQLEKDIAALTTELAAARVRTQEAKARFGQRLTALARLPSGARLLLLGGASSLSSYLETTRVLRWVAQHDRVVQQRYLDEAARLEAMEAQHTATRRELHAMERTAREQRDAIARRRGEREALLKSFVGDKAAHQRLGRERDAASRELTATLARLHPAAVQKARFSDNRGTLPWPAAGEVVARFGQRVEQVFGTTTAHHGIDIRAAAGSAVQAIAPAEVVFSDWLPGYGRLVILDHGEQYHSLVAHLGSTSVKTGDVVVQGAPLGTVGDTGSTRGTLLYFELRHRGRPIDPAPWLRR